MEVETLVDLVMAEAQTEVVLLHTIDQKCTRQFVPNVEESAKCLSNRMVVDQSTVVLVLKPKVAEKTDHRETQDQILMVTDQVLEVTPDQPLMHDLVMMVEKET